MVLGYASHGEEETEQQVVIHLFFMHNVRVHGFDPGFQEGFSWSFLYVKEEKINTYIHGIHGDWCQPPAILAGS